VIAKVESAACLGLHAYPVEVEVDVAQGLPQLTLVGLPDISVKESRERVRSAIKNSGFPFPPERVTINLAPAEIKKEGPSFDLPIALGILAACDVIPLEKLKDYIFLGELALDGSLRPFKGAIVVAGGIFKKKMFVFPEANAREASFESHIEIYPVKTLREVVNFLRGEMEIPPFKTSHAPAPFHEDPHPVDFDEIKGQFFAKRAAEIAVAGGHNLLLIGSPGAGKTMIARRIPTLMPPLDTAVSLEITKIHSVAGLMTETCGLITQRPFRSPHHSISAVAMAGGGTWPKPGELSLAHGGVLFLDEFPEFRRDVIETLRTPLEEGRITVSRAKMQVTYPSRILLVAAMNPCQCGYLTDPRKSCRCSLGQIQKYRSRISGPILDRIDLHVEVPTLSYQTLTSNEPAENSSAIRRRVLECRSVQEKRYPDKHFKLNALMSPREVKTWAMPDTQGKKLIEAAMKELRLSARAYYKILKIARTISDLAGCEQIQSEHIAEAIQYRSLDRQWWS